MILTGAQVFDGQTLRDGIAVRIAGDRVAAIGALTPSSGEQVVQLDGGILAPGFIDLQVNGGGGIMLNGQCGVAEIARICDAHARLGATGIMPTLITDTPDATEAVVAAGIEAARQRVAGFLGLHLEGPHIDTRRHGAHDPALIRPMGDDDLALLIRAARELPALIVTLAPASVSTDQIAALSHAGAIVSLGHAECDHAQARAAQQAGASMATHLFNAMSQLGSREPGLVGAVLDGDLDCGIIADGIHVHPATLRAALAAKPTGRAFLVSDAMAVAGTDDDEFTLGGRRILRRDGRLTLENGTLAGADLDLRTAVGNAVGMLGLSQETALAMASAIPARIIGAADRGHIAPGARADLVHLSAEFALNGVWRGGARL